MIASKEKKKKKKKGPTVASRQISTRKRGTLDHWRLCFVLVLLLVGGIYDRGGGVVCFPFAILPIRKEPRLSAFQPSSFFFLIIHKMAPVKAP